MAQRAQTQPADRLAQQKLYVFDLPEELLYTLQLKLQHTAASDTDSTSPERTSSPASPSLNGLDAAQEEVPKAATSCALCSLTFAHVQEQRSHIRSDLHGYNLKQRMRGKAPVGEADFERLIGQLDESLSGSDSSDSEDDSDEEHELSGNKTKDSTLTALLRRQAKITDGDAEDAPRKKQRGQGKPPLLWFTSPKLPPNTALGVYRAIFTTDEQNEETKLVEVLWRKQLAPKPPPSQSQKRETSDDEGGVPLPSSMLPKITSASGPHYFLCMIGGGHFAAMLVSLTPKLTKKAGIEDRAATVLAHKTFHRYTTRRKQGGSQSANDNSKGNAHSAGAGIRRYNEAALTQEVRDLLSEWRPWIDSAELLFIRATGSTNRRTLFGPYEDQVLSAKDARLRGFPFSTRRATQSELMRAFVELTRVKVSTVDEAALQRQAEEAAAAAARAANGVANGKPSTPKPAKPSKQEEEAAMHTTQLQALIRRSKAPAMLSYLQSSKLDPNFQFHPAEHNHHAPTPLHLAAASNAAACVTALLVKAGANPTLRNEDGKSAFDIAGDRATRDAFRLARSQLGEQKWEWDDAGVPSPLSHAEVDKRTAREKEERAADEAAEKQRRQAEMERIRREDVGSQEAGKEKKLGKDHVMQKPQLTAEERRMEEARGMTDEMRMKLEREKRARAAEERMKRLQGR
ncbi:hypothetical protein BAUCODRAFT_381036 [Baudoinia panamericana UAMH 10762]|uniref:VLRF1 domain-containing protein n=1 Tax=Baudoinia panamericana (strain UAMH 10762) TaxID=717646 RepID=M2MPX0_BAUPA|nr:uncharacterized protein BAUCODRAFT_381036 [Baudoinia panamericana UAMH 10762]EMC98816.1 hypothetical protein BAUCODRAFT_381036 [Baudoinia panamericana UAMH 10762]